MPRRHVWRSRVRAAAIAASLAALTVGCDAMGVTGNGSQDALTPDESKAQVIDSAREIVAALNLDVTRALFWRESCNDQGEAPFRGVVSIWYPPAATLEASQAEVAGMVERLRATGWIGADEFRTHSTAVKKNDVVAVFAPQAVDVPNRGIDLFGACGDTTTGHATEAQDITLGRRIP